MSNRAVRLGHRCRRQTQHAPLLVIVENLPFGVGHERSTAVVRIRAEQLAKEGPWVAFLRCYIKGVCLVGRALLVARKVFIGETSVLKVADKLPLILSPAMSEIDRSNPSMRVPVGNP